jgi:hypothetical protein
MLFETTELNAYFVTIIITSSFSAYTKTPPPNRLWAKALCFVGEGVPQYALGYQKCWYCFFAYGKVFQFLFSHREVFDIHSDGRIGEVVIGVFSWFSQHRSGLGKVTAAGNKWNSITHLFSFQIRGSQIFLKITSDTATRKERQCYRFKSSQLRGGMWEGCTFSHVQFIIERNLAMFFLFTLIVSTVLLSFQMIRVRQ